MDFTRITRLYKLFPLGEGGRDGRASERVSERSEPIERSLHKTKENQLFCKGGITPPSTSSLEEIFLSATPPS